MPVALAKHWTNKCGTYPVQLKISREDLAGHSYKLREDNYLSSSSLPLSHRRAPDLLQHSRAQWTTIRFCYHSPGIKRPLINCKRVLCGHETKRMARLQQITILLKRSLLNLIAQRSESYCWMLISDLRCNMVESVAFSYMPITVWAEAVWTWLWQRKDDGIKQLQHIWVGTLMSNFTNESCSRHLEIIGTQYFAMQN